MEDSNSMRKGKRTLDDNGDDDDYRPTRASKQQKIPALSRGMLEALKLYVIQILTQYLAPTIHKIFREELSLVLNPGNLEPLIQKIANDAVQQVVKTDSPGTLAGGPSAPEIQGSGGQKLQLRFETKMPDSLFARGKVEGEGGSGIRVVLIDPSNGSVVQRGQASAAKLNIVVLHGDFNEDLEGFKSHIVKERDGKCPLLVGNVQMKLKDGEGILGTLSFTDNSSWTRSKKFKLGVELAPGFCEGLRVMEATTNSFSVKDQRGESYQKHYPPALYDEVWRLNGIAKDKTLHKRLLHAGISTVEDLLRFHAKDPQGLKTLLGNGITEKKWDTTIEHAKSCGVPPGGKIYVFYIDSTQSSGVIFNHFHCPTAFMSNGQVIQLESLEQTQKVSHLVNRAYENWLQVKEYDDDQDFTSLITTQTSHPYIPFEPDQQVQLDNIIEPLLKFPFPSFDPTTTRMPCNNPETGESSGAGCSYNPDELFKLWENDEFDGYVMRLSMEPELEPRYDEPPEVERVNSTAVAVVGWLNIKAALKWGMVTRKKAAEKRAQLTELA